MEGVKHFLTRKLRLKVNDSKSAVARPKDRKFLGFSFTWGESAKRRIAPQAVLRFKEQIRELTRRTRGISIEQMIRELRRYMIGIAKLLRFLRDPQHTQALGYVDPKAPTLLHLEAMETWTSPLQGIEDQGNWQEPRRTNGGECTWAMAAE